MPQENLAWSSVQLYQTGDPYFADLLFDIRHAQSKITLEVYIFEIDPLTLMILDELEKAQSRGCQVYLLVDGFGSYFWLNSLEKEIQKRKIQFKIFQSFPRGLNWFRSFWMISIFHFFKLLRRLNHRNHRKIYIVDEKIAYLGSLNMTQVHSEKLMGENAWKDTGIRVTGGSLEDLNRAFWIAWSRASHRGFRGLLKKRARDKHYRPSSSLVRLNATTWSRFWLYRDLLKRIKSAQQHILIETAYFLPKRSLLRALKKAAQRGVQVEIIIPFRTDVPLVKWAAESLIHSLSQSGVIIHEYIPRVLHSKFLIIDHWAAIGSHNWNHRSFLQDLEVEVILTSAETAFDQIYNDWHEDRKKSLRVSEKDFRGSNFFKTWIGRLAFRLRYLL